MCSKSLKFVLYFLINNDTKEKILGMSHRNTVFTQMISLIPRKIFTKLEKQHACGRKSRKFGFKEQFIFMAFFIFAASRSLRDAIASLAAQGSRLYHWGLTNVARSTVSDANRTRPYQFFEDLYLEIVNFCISHAPKHKFKFSNKLFSIDSTIITLTSSIFKWAAYRSSKKGVKIHTVLNHDGYIPSFVYITEAKSHDSKIFDKLKLPENSFVVFDRAYSAVKWFTKICKDNISFITRIKIDMKFSLIERQKIDPNTGITSDHIIEMQNSDEKITLRKIGYRDPVTNKHYVYLTNNFEIDAKTIADIYKSRWQIELFFKELKQFIKIKKFIGTNENAVKIQIYTAMIVYLLIALQKFLSKAKMSIGQLFQLIQLNLVTFRTLDDLLPQKKKSNICLELPLWN